MAPRWRPSAKPLRTETASSLGDSADRLQGRVADADAGCWYPWTRINCLLRGKLGVLREHFFGINYCQERASTQAISVNARPERPGTSCFFGQAGWHPSCRPTE